MERKALVKVWLFTMLALVIVCDIVFRLHNTDTVARDIGTLLGCMYMGINIILVCFEGVIAKGKEVARNLVTIYGNGLYVLSRLAFFERIVSPTISNIAFVASIIYLVLWLVSLSLWGLYSIKGTIDR